MNPNILFVNSIQKQCGVNSYGTRSFSILNKSRIYDFIYAEVDSWSEYVSLCIKHDPAGVIFNYHPLTMPWIQDLSNYPRQTHYILTHEGSLPTNLHPDCWLNVDSTAPEHDNFFSIPRPIISYPWYHLHDGAPKIGSFGMSFGDKGFGRIVQMVNDQFDEAVIRLHMPRAYYGDRNGEARAGVIPGCYNEMKKPGIQLEITEEWLDDWQLLSFLGENSINVFLYDEMAGRGLSSAIDYAISSNRPLAINDSYMFRHIQAPDINVKNHTLSEIMFRVDDPLVKYRKLWSNENFLSKYEQIINETL